MLLTLRPIHVPCVVNATSRHASMRGNDAPHITHARRRRAACCSENAQSSFDFCVVCEWVLV